MKNRLPPRGFDSTITLQKLRLDDNDAITPLHKRTHYLTNQSHKFTTICQLRESADQTSLILTNVYPYKNEKTCIFDVDSLELKHTFDEHLHDFFEDLYVFDKYSTWVELK